MQRVVSQFVASGAASPERSQAGFDKAVSRNPLAGCHALQCRVTAPEVRQRIASGFAAVARSIAEVLDDAEPPAFVPRLWVEKCPWPSDSAQAKTRLEKEFTFPLSARAGCWLRAVMLEFSDGVAELLLLARTERVDRRTLETIAVACIEGTFVRVDQPARSRPASMVVVPVQKSADRQLSLLPNWTPLPGEPGAGRYCQRLRQRVAPQDFMVALASTLAAYCGTNRAAVAYLAGERGGDAGAHVVPDWQLVDLGFDGVIRAADHAAQIGEQLQQVSPIQGKDASMSWSGESGDWARASVGVVFVSQQPPTIPGVTSWHYRPCLAGPFPLTIVCRETSEGIALEYLSDPDVYPDTAVTSLAQSLATALRALDADPHRRVAQLPLLCRPDFAAMTRDLQAAPVARDVTRSRIEVAFDRQASRTPNATALWIDQQRFSYRQLQEAANQYAAVLLEGGLQARDRVGICLPRSIDLVLTMLAVLKAGAVYVPLDPDYPRERLQHTVDDAGMRLVIGDCAGASGAKVLSIDELRARAVSMSTELTYEADLTPEDPAYIIYTSGSTGRPKGVVVPHSNVLSLLAATRHDFDLSDTDVWALFHSCAFDFSVWEVWGALLTGAKLVIVPYWVSRSALEFYRLVEEQRITVLNQTPSAFYQFIEEANRAAHNCAVRLVILGGEPLDAKAVLPWLDRYPEPACRVVNMYGITETTVHVTSHDVTRADALSGTRVVGRPLAGWYVYVLDAAQRVLPLGVLGEIYVGGAGVACGYHDRADLTGERFVDDPLRPGRTVYRTGDKGRLLPNGTLEHLGRVDDQIKLRGFRIETGEIRHVLLSLPGVQSAAVVLQQDDPRDPASARLNAYVVADGVSAAELRDGAGRLLPQHMIPSGIYFVQEMPLTVNGKLDRKRLPEMVIADDSSGSADANISAGGEASGDVQRQLIDIWQEVLGCEVTASDNFFDLGGNSLYAMRILSAMQACNLPQISSRDLYLCQTIDKLVENSACEALVSAAAQ